MHTLHIALSLFTACALVAALVPVAPRVAAHADEDAASVCGARVDESAGADVVAREQEADEHLAEALAQAEGDRAQVEAAAQAEADVAAQVEAADEARIDGSLTDEDVILSDGADGVDEAAASSFSLRSEDAARYSIDITYKDITSLHVYEMNGDGSIFDCGMLNIDGFNPDACLAYVECRRIPSFYAKIASTKIVDGKFYLELALPTPAGEEQTYLDVLWGYVNGSYSRPVSQHVGDETILASLELVRDYDAAHRTAYLNAYALAPFASPEDIVRSGNAIPADSPFATKTIVESWPVHQDAGMKVSLRSSEVADVARAVVCFSDGTSQTLDVSYLGTSHLAASYVAAEPEILYQPDFWVLDDSVSGNAIEKVASFIKGKTWNTYFKSFCRDVTMHRTVRDYFDRTMHDNAEEVAANLLTNVSGWCATAPDTKVYNAIMTRAMEAKPETTLSSTIREHKMFDLLFLYAYLERFYGFDLGGSESVGAQKNVNPFLLIAFRGDVISSGLSLVDLTPAVQYSWMYTFSLTDKTSSGAYAALLASRTGAPDVPSFLELVVKRTTGYRDMANWFADYMSSRYFYREFEPVGAEGVDTSGLMWRGWDQVKRFPDYLLAWVTLDDASQYMGVTAGLLATGTSTGYYADPKLDDEHRAAFDQRMSEKVFDHMAKYAATASTFVGTDRVNDVCVVSVDRKWNINEGTAWLEREKLWGKTLTEDAYCKNFTDAVGLYNSKSMGAAAMTVNLNSHYKRLFFFYGALDCGWSAFWSHELAHALDTDWFLQGGTRRAGTEDYTDGLLTQGFGQYSYSMNLARDYDLSADVATNLTRARISSKEKLNDYYGKMYDALDVLDYAALKAFLRLDADEQNAVASQAQYDGQNGSSALDIGATATVLRSRNAVLNGYDGTAATAPVNLSAFVDGTRKFETPEEVYDNQIFLRPGISETGKVSWLWDLYVQDDLRSVWWHPIHANGNHPDSRSFKLQMYRMLGDCGYDAFAEFGSGGGGDLSKLTSITGADSFRAYQLAKWDAIERDADSLTYVAFDDLVAKFEAALKADALRADRNLSQMTSLRTRMYYLMKRMTGDFTYGLYDNQVPITYIHNLDELRAIHDNPYGNYALANDIDASAFDGADGQALVEGVFYGKLDGCGHAIYANERVLPVLFSGTKNAYLKDVTLKGGVSAKPAITTANSEYENVQYDLFAQKIYTIDDLANIPNDTSGANTFMLMNDLDFSDWKPETAGGAVVAGVFGGTADSYKEFNGNGHRIVGLNDATLFDGVCWANVHDLVITDSSNRQNAASGSGVSLVAKASAASQFSDLFFENVSLQGKDRIGFVSGSDGFIDYQGNAKSTYGSRFDRIQVVDGTVRNGVKDPAAQNQTCYVGFVTGRALNADFNDVYVQGKITTYGTCCGGVVGAITQSSRLDRCISNVDIERLLNYNYTGNEVTKNGCVLGDIESIGDSAKYGETRVSNCVGLGDPAAGTYNPCGRLAWSAPSAGAAARTVFANCFENAYVVRGASLTGLAGVTWVNTGDSFRAFKVSQPAYDVPDLRNNKAFFTNLGFDEDVWDFDVTIPAGYPVLRVLDESSVSFDTNISVDYQSEKIVLSGSDYSAFGTYVSKLPMWNKIANQPYDSPMELRLSVWNGASASYAGDDGEIDLSEIIELDLFGADTREIVFRQYPADSGKAVVYEQSVAVPPRFDNPDAGSITGIDAIEAGGRGAIGISATALQGAAGGFEYQRVPDELLQYETESADGSHTIIPSSKFPQDGWVDITGTTTAVEPGTYAVRLGSHEKAFASNPVIIAVGDYDATAVRASVSFDVGGGTWANEADVPAHYVEGKRLALPGADAVSRDGYSFVGWYERADFSGEPLTEIPADATGSLTLHARWRAETYPVELVLNDGYFETSDDNVLSYRYGVETPLPASPLREGHVFAGWYDNESFAGDPVSCISASDQGAKRFYAKWDVASCGITYHLGGSGGSNGSGGDGGAEGPTFAPGVDEESYASYVPGQAFMLPTAADLAWDGYVFEGWYDNEACEGEPVTEIAASDTGDKEFFAKWESGVYVVSYVTHGGTFDPEPHRVYRTEDGFAAGDTVVLPTADDITKDKHVFEGWYEQADYSGEPLTSIALDEKNVTLYAKWTLNQFDVVLHANGGAFATGVADRFTYQGGEGKELPGADGISRDGYRFAGWYDNAECTGEGASSIAASDRGDKQLWAKWEPYAYGVTLHANEGELASGVSNELTYHVGTGAVLPKADEISRIGHDFCGWFDNAACKGAAVLHVSPTEMGNKEFWAKWEPCVYAVTLEYNGGLPAAQQANVTEYAYGTGAVLPTAEREGYRFVGWFDTPDCTGDAVSAIDGTAVGAKAFYAGWEPVEAVDPNPPAEPSLEIISLALSPELSPSPSPDDCGEQVCEWDESGYAKIALPRERMPKTAADFKIEVPEGVGVKIEKRSAERAMTFSFAMRAVDEATGKTGVLASESDLWDITLYRKADPNVKKVFTLEIVPRDSVAPGPDGPSVGPDDPSVAPDGPSVAPDAPGVPGAPGGDDGQGAGDGGNRSDGGADGDAAAAGSDAAVVGGDAAAGSSASPQASGAKQLAPTGDRLLAPSAMLAAFALLSACLVAAAASRRAAGKRR